MVSNEQQLEFFWFPWCTSAYVEEFVEATKKELRESGAYFGVRSYGGYISIKVARNPNGGPYLDRHECIELGLIEEVIVNDNKK